MFTHLFAQDVRVLGDLYLEVADAYIALVDQDRESVAILQQLLGREEFPMDQVLYSLGPADESDDAFLSQSSDGEDGMIEEENSDIERQLWVSLVSAEDEEESDDDVGANGVSQPRKCPPS
ncbi:hypothetical protein PsorP6_019373 [Peronosclerospora sorghi]|nr:hypothetical protein PsorP6_019373 [Peronosclerospora sorghi]